MHLHVLQHVPFEGPASIADWVRRRGHVLSQTRLFEAQGLPAPDAVDGLIVMGGPMGVGDEDEFPWLVHEKRFLAACVENDKPVLGICLGSQLLAEVLGAPVYPNRHKEIGWFPIEFTQAALGSPLFDGCPQEIEVFHWHGDTFDLPHGARLLASSQACRNQAFLHGRHVLGLQFHLEVTSRSIAALVENGAAELRPAPYIQPASRLSGTPEQVRKVNTVMHKLLDRLFVP